MGKPAMLGLFQQPARLKTHNQYVTLEASATAARKFRASLSYRVATRRQSLSLENVRSMTLRKRYALRSNGCRRFLVGLFGMTGVVPVAIRSARKASLSYAASARQSSGAKPATSSAATGASPRWPGRTIRRLGLPRSSTAARILVVRPPRERPMAWMSAPLFRQRPNDAL